MLATIGYVESAERLQKEAGLGNSKFEVADNIDLPLILGEYEDYYEMRFEKKPKIVRKLREDEIEKKTSMASKAKGKTSSGSSKLPPVSNAAKVEAAAEAKAEAGKDDKDGGDDMGIKGLSVTATSAPVHKKAVSSSGEDNSDYMENRYVLFRRTV